MQTEFDAVNHRHLHGGEEIPGVTRLIRSVGMMPTYGDHWAMQRGSDVHLATEYFDHNDLDWDTVRDEVRPYVEGWAEFRAVTKFTPRKIETQEHDHAFNYATIIDREGDFAGEDAVIEIKSGAYSPWWGIQLALQDRCLEKSRKGYRARFAVQLSKDGGFKLHRFLDPADYQCAVAVAGLYHWRRRNGIG